MSAVRQANSFVLAMPPERGVPVDVAARAARPAINPPKPSACVHSRAADAARAQTPCGAVLAPSLACATTAAAHYAARSGAAAGSREEGARFAVFAGGVCAGRECGRGELRRNRSGARGMAAQDGVVAAQVRVDAAVAPGPQGTRPAPASATAAPPGSFVENSAVERHAAGGGASEASERVAADSPQHETAAERTVAQQRPSGHGLSSSGGDHKPSTLSEDEAARERRKSEIRAAREAKRNVRKKEKTAAVQVQKLVRGASTRRDLLRKKESAVTVQRVARGAAARKYVRQREGSVRNIQRVYRGHRGRSRYARERAAAIEATRTAGMGASQRRKEHRAAKDIQEWWLHRLEIREMLHNMAVAKTLRKAQEEALLARLAASGQLSSPNAVLAEKRDTGASSVLEETDLKIRRSGARAFRQAAQPERRVKPKQKRASSVSMSSDRSAGEVKEFIRTKKKRRDENTKAEREAEEAERKRVEDFKAALEERRRRMAAANEKRLKVEREVAAQAEARRLEQQAAEEKRRAEERERVEKEYKARVARSRAVAAERKRREEEAAAKAEQEKAEERARRREEQRKLMEKRLAEMEQARLEKRRADEREAAERERAEAEKRKEMLEVGEREARLARERLAQRKREERKAAKEKKKQDERLAKRRRERELAKIRAPHTGGGPTVPAQGDVPSDSPFASSPSPKHDRKRKGRRREKGFKEVSRAVAADRELDPGGLDGVSVGSRSNSEDGTSDTGDLAADYERRLASLVAAGELAKKQKAAEGGSSPPKNDKPTPKRRDVRSEAETAVLRASPVSLSSPTMPVERRKDVSDTENAGDDSSNRVFHKRRRKRSKRLDGPPGAAGATKPSASAPTSVTRSSHPARNRAANKPRESRNERARVGRDGKRRVSDGDAAVLPVMRGAQESDSYKPGWRLHDGPEGRTVDDEERSVDENPTSQSNDRGGDDGAVAAFVEGRAISGNGSVEEPFHDQPGLFRPEGPREFSKRETQHMREMFLPKALQEMLADADRSPVGLPGMPGGSTRRRGGKRRRKKGHTRARGGRILPSLTSSGPGQNSSSRVTDAHGRPVEQRADVPRVLAPSRSAPSIGAGVPAPSVPKSFVKPGESARHFLFGGNLPSLPSATAYGAWVPEYMEEPTSSATPHAAPHQAEMESKSGAARARQSTKRDKATKRRKDPPASTNLSMAGWPNDGAPSTIDDGPPAFPRSPSPITLSDGKAAGGDGRAPWEFGFDSDDEASPVSTADGSGPPSVAESPPKPTPTRRDVDEASVDSGASDEDADTSGVPRFDSPHYDEVGIPSRMDFSGESGGGSKRSATVKAVDHGFSPPRTGRTLGTQGTESTSTSQLAALERGWRREAAKAGVNLDGLSDSGEEYSDDSDGEQAERQAQQGTMLSR